MQKVTKNIKNTGADITITAVGDICLSDHLLCTGFGVSSNIDKHGYDFLFTHIKDHFFDSDLIFGNLECVLSDKKPLNNTVKDNLFKGKSKYIKVLNKAGFNCLNIANNHTMQHGVESFNDTVKLLKENEIQPLGLHGKENYFSEPCIINKNKCKCAIVGYSFVKDKISEEPLYVKGDLQNIISDIK